MTAGHQQSPSDDGVPLATIGRDGNRELRIRWKTFKNFDYLDVREWSRRDASSPFWPTKGKGVTIKKHELPAVLEAVAAAARLAHVDQGDGREQRGVR
jgi:hypothetical protein